MLPDTVVIVDDDKVPYHNLETLKQIIKRVALRKLGLMEISEKRLEEAA